MIGKDTIVWTPYGERRLTYADYTASGRMLSFIEAYMRDTVYPLYANTHTEASATGERVSQPQVKSSLFSTLLCFI